MPIRPINFDSKVGVQEQVYDRVKRAIVTGQLLPGHRIPPVRALAQELGVARGTVAAAYRRLAGEGFVVAAGAAGTRVAPGVAPRPMPPTRPDDDVPFFKLIQGAIPLPLQVGMPAMDVFPRKLWVRTIGRAARSASAADMSYPDPSGIASLRRALAGYLQVSRGIVCDPRQIFVTTGFQGSADLVTRIAIERGDRVWIEDPGYRPIPFIVGAAGAEPVPIPVDRHGLVVDDGVASAPDAKAAFVAPAHQFPTGVTMSADRRRQLLEWASRARAWVVEDDYDGEYRYDGYPLAALKSSDADDRVFYCGTFSKVLYPALRIAFVVVPQSQVVAADRHAQIFQHGPSPLMQAALADFIVDGHFARHLSRMRTIYAKRRDLMLHALRKTFGGGISVGEASGGMHLTLRTRSPDAPIVACAHASGLGVMSLSIGAIARDPEHGVLIGFANTPDAKSADELLVRLRRCIEQASETRPTRSSSAGRLVLAGHGRGR